MEQMTPREIEDEKMVSQAYRHLAETYLNSHHRKHIEIIEKAFNFAKEAHKGVRRLSGEPYIMHPIAVAQIACEEIGLGSTSICAALLHDVVEDTDFTVEDISNIFGSKIAEIVDGLTKISGGIFGDKASAQAETFKKLLLTMSDDIRVILVKISDRLHNMRTLGSQLPNKQYKIAGETLYIYAPLANRLGLYKVKEELEDLSFRYEHPEEYQDIRNRLSQMNEHLHEIFEQFTQPIRERLDAAGLKYEIRERIKAPYSIWCKMQNKHIPFEEIYDILAVRIIFDPDDIQNESTQCFQIYASCSSIYKPHPERFRDWISHPKANGYQALHTTLMDSSTGRWIEVQIRSRRMNDMAEQGFAAHWKYKEGSHTTEDSENELDKWLHTIKEILDDPQPNAIDFLDAIKLNLFATEIFVVTPRGDFKTMPAGCTVLDFAFSIHTFLGTHCMGAKVNHKLVPLSHKLESGDQVEILTSRNTKVAPEWLSFATTAKAKSKITLILRREQRERQKHGEDLLLEYLQQSGVENNAPNLAKLCVLHNLESKEELYAAIGSGHITLGKDDYEALQRHDQGKKAWERYLTFFHLNRGDKEEAHDTGRLTEDLHLKIDKKKPLILNEATLCHYLICDQCHPIPGDDVLGYLDAKGRITIHQRQCPVADKLKMSDGNHILAAIWDTHKQMSFPATIHLSGIDHVGVLHSITGILSKQMNVNIRRLSIQTNDGIFNGEIQMEVHDASDLQEICRDLKNIDEIQEVTRF